MPIDNIKILAYQKNYTKINDDYINNVFSAGTGEQSIVAITNSNPSNIAAGKWSYAGGVFTVSDGEASHAEGYETSARGRASHAEGEGTRVEGRNSHAEGCGTTVEAGADYSHVEGHSTIVRNSNAHAEGSGTIAEGNSSHAEGSMTVAKGFYSHAEGEETATHSSHTHAEGGGTYAYGMYSHAEGGAINTTSINVNGSGTSYTANSSISSKYIGKRICYSDYNTNTEYNAYITSVNSPGFTVSDSLGNLTGKYCRIFAASTSAIGLYSHAEGIGTTAEGNYSHAEGYYNYAKGLGSHAGGYYTIASGQYQHTFGKYNVEDLNNTYAEIVGIGTSTSARKNGRTLDWSGNEQLAGSLTLGLGTTDQTTITAAQLKQLLALLS